MDKTLPTGALGVLAAIAVAGAGCNPAMQPNSREAFDRVKVGDPEASTKRAMGSSERTRWVYVRADYDINFDFIDGRAAGAGGSGNGAAAELEAAWRDIPDDSTPRQVEMKKGKPHRICEIYRSVTESSLDILLVCFSAKRVVRKDVYVHRNPVG